MEHKVKYTRREYRDEYLKSPEWVSLRETILKSSPDCQCCKKKANDVHHLIYRNFVDTKVTDLLPVCRDCHGLIHEAINNKWITQKVTDLDKIREKTINILHDEEYKKFREFLDGKHFLSEAETTLIKNLHGFIIQKISGLVKRNVWHDNISEMKFTGRQIVEIRKIINLGVRRRNKKYKRQKPRIGHYIMRL